MIYIKLRPLLQAPVSATYTIQMRFRRYFNLKTMTLMDNAAMALYFVTYRHVTFTSRSVCVQ